MHIRNMYHLYVNATLSLSHSTPTYNVHQLDHCHTDSLAEIKQTNIECQYNFKYSLSVILWYIYIQAAGIQQQYNINTAIICFGPVSRS